MDYREGTVFELGDLKQKFVVLSTTKINNDESEYIIVVPIEGTVENPIIRNSNPIVFRKVNDGIEIVADKEIITSVLMG